MTSIITTDPSIHQHLVAFHMLRVKVKAVFQFRIDDPNEDQVIQDHSDYGTSVEPKNPCPG